MEALGKALFLLAGPVVYSILAVTWLKSLKKTKELTTAAVYLLVKECLSQMVAALSYSCEGLLKFSCPLLHGAHVCTGAEDTG